MSSPAGQPSDPSRAPAPTLSAQAILSQFSPKPLNIRKRGVLFLSGFDASRITAYSQQNRAISLVEALVEAEALRPEGVPGTVAAQTVTSIGVIGGGLTGVTFACWAACHGAHVTVYERSPNILSVYDRADHRVLHPGLFNWPHPGWEQVATGLPCLNWSRSTAQQVGTKLRSQAEALEKELGSPRFRIRRDFRELSLRVGEDPDVPVVVGAGGQQFTHDLLVFAVGFGVDGNPGPSYWDGEQDRRFMAQARDPRTRRVVVLGNGDGAIMDVLRLRTRLKDEDAVLAFLERWQDHEPGSYSAVVEAIRRSETLGRQTASTEEYQKVLDDALVGFETPWPMKCILEGTPEWEGRWIEVLGRQGALHAGLAPLLRTLWYFLRRADEGRTVRPHQVTLDLNTWRLSRPWSDDRDPAEIDFKSPPDGLLVLNRLGPDRPLESLQALSVQKAGDHKLLKVADMAGQRSPTQESDFFSHHYLFPARDESSDGYRRPAEGYSRPAPAPLEVHKALDLAMASTAAHVAIPVLIRTKGESAVAPGDPMRLLSVYVGLDVVRHRDPSSNKRKQDAGAASEPNPPMPFLKSLESGGDAPLRSLLAADGGRGKTTLLGFLTLALTAGDVSPEGVDPEVTEQLDHVRRRWAGKQACLIRLRELAGLRLKPSDRFEWVLLSQLYRQAYPRGARRLIPVERSSRLVPEWFRLPVLEALQGGRVLLLLDGMDELPDSERRELAKCLARFVAVGGLGAQTDVLLSARKATVLGPTESRWSDDLGWPVLEIQPLSNARADGQPSQRERFAGRYFTLLDSHSANPAADLMQACERRDLKEMTAEPLLLAGLVRLYHRRRQELPSTRVGVLDGVIRLMLTDWDLHRGVPNQVRNRTAHQDGEGLAEVCMDALTRVALRSLSSADGKSAIRYRDLREELEFLLDAKGVPDTQHLAVDLAEVLIERICLLRRTDAERFGAVDFPVAIYRNHLAGIRLMEDPGNAVDTYVRSVGTSATNSEHWRQALALGAAAWEQGLTGPRSTETDLVPGEELSPSDLTWRLLEVLTNSVDGQPNTKVQADLLAAAGEVAREARITRHFPSWAHDAAPRQLRELRKAASKAFEGPRKHLKVLALRASLLGWLGDFRPGVGRTGSKGDRPWLEWSDEIAPGPFRMGGDGEDAFQCGLIQRPYRLGLYPVTVAQFARFVEWGGYTDKAELLWPVQGWKIMRGEASPIWELVEVHKLRSLYEDWFGSEVRPWRGPRSFGARFDTPNHPVVGVSWDEAVAFCRWLNHTETGRLGLPQGWKVRLSTEAEWERAASVRAGQTMEYPWGSSKNVAGRCNARTTELEGTSAVGLFGRQGAAECRAEELSGNVLEWCSTAWRPDYQAYEQAPEIRAECNPTQWRAEADRSELRVVRGGAWNGDPDGCRAAYRNWSHPETRSSLLGFRLAASPISEL